MPYFSTNSTRGNTPSSKRMTPKQNSAGRTKKVAVSSFIQQEEKPDEEFLPDKANWDASAIEPLKFFESDNATKENDPGKISRDLEIILIYLVYKIMCWIYFSLRCNLLH